MRVEWSCLDLHSLWPFLLPINHVIVKGKRGTKMRNSSAVVVNLDKLEQVVRKVVRQELSRLVRKRKGESGIEIGSPIYEDLLDITRRKKQGRVKVYPRSRVFGG